MVAVECNDVQLQSHCSPLGIMLVDRTPETKELRVKRTLHDWLGCDSGLSGVVENNGTERT